MAGKHDQAEYRWFLEIESKRYDELNGDDNGPIFSWLDPPFALALYKTCPQILQKRISDLEAKSARSEYPRLLTGRQVAWMILDYVRTDRYKTTFTTFADIASLPWAGDSPDQMESFLRNWDIIIDNMPEPGMPLDQQRDLSSKNMNNPKQ